MDFARKFSIFRNFFEKFLNVSLFALSETVQAFHFILSFLAGCLTPRSFFMRIVKRERS